MTATPSAATLDAGIRALGLDIALRDAAELAGRHPGTHPDNFGAGLVARPADTAALAGLVRWCRAEGIALVPQGGLTGLVGGTVSAPGMLAVSTDRMTAIEAIDAASGIAVVQAGATLEAVQQACAAVGMEPGIDLGSRGTATIGGLVSTNAGGIQAFRHGVMRHRVLGLEAVLPDGSLLSDMTQVVKNTTGYDVKQLLIGAEGTLGIVTRVVLKLSPLPAARAVALLALPDATAALRLGQALNADPALSLQACELMTRDFLHLNAEAQGTSLPGGVAEAPVTLLVETAGATPEGAAAALETALDALWEPCGLLDGIVAQSLDQARRLWHLREDMSVFAARYPGYLSCDISVPPARVGEATARINAALAEVEPGLSALVFAHLLDGNLHVIPRRGGLTPALRARLEDAIYGGLAAMGGAMSAEHGIGSKKQRAYEAHVPAAKRAMVAAIKAVLDPAGLFNPGKIVAVQGEQA
ncbi:FAD-binding oxidoreductase [Pararhodobacter sp. CCB-MM2]|uniref:FAD-binding oxidoreductase n=1 Tax=Pararhodobacter sp. CCB-MM2 TaxID=1786003 RepID=UPI00082CE949|nr:FAD-binding oxidoreductase [Pararhodobacter sp. CCB-MM2]